MDINPPYDTPYKIKGVSLLVRSQATGKTTSTPPLCDSDIDIHLANDNRRLLRTQDLRNLYSHQQIRVTSHLGHYVSLH